MWWTRRRPYSHSALEVACEVSEWSPWHGCTEAQFVLAGRASYIGIPCYSKYFQGLGWIRIGRIKIC